MFKNARSVPELVTAWQRFWAGLLHEVPEQVIKAFGDLYPVYRDDINRAGVFYNEAPVSTVVMKGMVLIGDAHEGDDPLVITGKHRVYVLGNLPVIVKENCSVHVNAERADVTVMGAARASVEQGNVVARDRAIVNGKGNITCYDSTSIYLTGGTLKDHGHLNIVAYNDAVINSFTNRRITLNDQAILNI